ncbi:MAG: hypothetical protein FJW39_08820 [Acidobacteria bacterium]|nr:hypothetical protein [Acidobacteriota bacterium]
MKKVALITALLSGALLAQSGRLVNGVYAVEQSSAAAKNPAVRQHEGKDLVLDAANFAPIAIVGTPQVHRGPGGSSLTVQLAPEAAKRLEELTKSQLNRTLAVVVGDRILSAPLVRSVITDGKARMTPCDDASCEALLRELAKK